MSKNIFKYANGNSVLFMFKYLHKMDERNAIVVPIRKVHIELGQAGVHKENQEDQAVNNSQAKEQFVKW